jgi:hypothetical protein
MDQWQAELQKMEKKGVVTGTFRREKCKTAAHRIFIKLQRNSAP